MNEVKDIQKLSPFLGEADLTKLEALALQYRKYSQITFKVLKCGDGELMISVRQDKPFNGNIADAKRLHEVGKDLFSKFFNGFVIHVKPVPYMVAPPEIVTPEWIQAQMFPKKISLKEIVAATGIDKTTLSALINGIRPLSQSMRAMFYYFFKSLEKE